jgi:transcriptional regulator with XRE-family HTH domain
MNISRIILKSPTEINKEIADRIRKIRKRKKLSQKELGARAGVSLGSVKRFESTGNISLLSLTKMAMVLGLSDDVDELFAGKQIASIEDIINGQ